MAIVKKIVAGYVEQLYDTDLKQFVKQEFVANNHVECEMEDGSVILRNIEDEVNSAYHPFEMIQPQPEMIINNDYHVAMPFSLLEQILKEMLIDIDIEDMIDNASYILGIKSSTDLANFSARIDYEEKNDEIVIYGADALTMFPSSIINMYKLKLIDTKGNIVDLDDNFRPIKADPAVVASMDAIQNAPVEDKDIEAELEKIRENSKIFIFPGTVKPEEPDVEAILVGVKRALIKKNKHFITYHVEVK